MIVSVLHCHVPFYLIDQYIFDYRNYMSQEMFNEYGSRLFFREPFPPQPIAYNGDLYPHLACAAERFDKIVFEYVVDHDFDILLITGIDQFSRDCFGIDNINFHNLGAICCVNYNVHSFFHFHSPFFFKHRYGIF